jgi:sulfur carrier protein ThiS adenylyltransferase
LNTEKIFERNVPGTRDILSKKVVAIAGCGGLGSNAAVALVRAGVGKLIIADWAHIF